MAEFRRCLDDERTCPTTSVLSTGVTSIPEAPELNPAQQQILDELGSLDRPQFRQDLRDDIRADLERQLGPIVATLDEADRPLHVSKHRLSQVHGCESRYLAEEAIPFEWTIASARGTVAHKALELYIGRRGQPTPLDLVEDAMSRLEADERSVGGYLVTLTEAERADLVTDVNDLIAGFQEMFPPIKRVWRPVTESRVRAEFADGSVVLRGAVDLTLGASRGLEAGKVIIDLKSGRPNLLHVEDLRLYALLETLKLGVPPRLLVSYYLDAGQPRTETVTEDLLWAVVARLVDAVTKMVELNAGREPEVRTGPVCRWCVNLDNCSTGTDHLARLDNE